MKALFIPLEINYIIIQKYEYKSILRIIQVSLFQNPQDPTRFTVYVIQQNVVIYKAYHHKCKIYENIYTRNIISFRKPL